MREFSRGEWINFPGDLITDAACAPQYGLRVTVAMVGRRFENFKCDIHVS